MARTQQIPVPLPAVLGHEGRGTVVETGKNVTGFKAGDRVGFSFTSCGHCDHCLSGKPYACRNFNAINFGGVMPDGTKRLSKDGRPISAFFGQSAFAEYAVVSEKNVVRVPYEDIDLALVGPLGCGIQTGAGTVLNYLKPAFGSKIAVFGCGTIGMSAIMAAKIAGCETIIAVGGNPHSLDLARELGATDVVNRKTCEDIPARIKEITAGGADCSVETSGTENFLLAGLRCLAFEGKEAVVGVGGEIHLNAYTDLMQEAKTLAGVIEGDSVPQIFIPKLLSYYRKGLFPFDKLIGFYPFEKINEAGAMAKKEGVIKPVLRME